MRAIYLVPVFFAIPLAAAWVTERPGFAQAAAQAAAPQPASDECLSKPGASAPQGSHWYYRINRADRRHCWYLGPDGARSRAHEAARSSTPKPIRQRTSRHAGASTAPQGAPSEAAPAADAAAVAPVPDAFAQATAQATLQPAAQAVRVQAAPAQPVVADSDPGAQFANRWPDLPRSIDLNSRRSASAAGNSYTEEQSAKAEHDEMPLVWPVLTSAEEPAAKPAMQSTATWVYILGLLSGSLALAAVLLRAIGNRSAARQVARAASPDRRRVRNVSGQQTTGRSQFADALAAALHADALSSSIVDVCKVDLARPLMTDVQERSEAADKVDDRADDDVEVCLERLLNGWQRVAA
jgi:hypothetical protein